MNGITFLAALLPSFLHFFPQLPPSFLSNLLFEWHCAFTPEETLCLVQTFLWNAHCLIKGGFHPLVQKNYFHHFSFNSFMTESAIIWKPVHWFAKHMITAPVMKELNVTFSTTRCRTDWNLLIRKYIQNQ